MVSLCFVYFSGTGRQKAGVPGDFTLRRACHFLFSWILRQNTYIENQTAAFCTASVTL